MYIQHTHRQEDETLKARCWSEYMYTQRQDEIQDPKVGHHSTRHRKTEKLCLQNPKAVRQSEYTYVATAYTQRCELE